MLPAVQRARLDALYERQRRGLRLQLAQEGGKLPSLALQLQLRASGLLRTQPTRPCRFTSRWTKGRNPTPWTMPRTSM